MSVDTVDVRGIGINVGAAVGVFGLVGFGLGFSGFLTMVSIKGQLSGAGESAFGQLLVGLVFLQNLYTTFLLGTIVAAFTGLFLGYTSDDDLAAAIGGGVGSGIGFYVMAVVSLVLLLLGLGGSGGDVGELDGFILPFLGGGIPSAIVGLTTAYGGSLLGKGDLSLL